MATTKVEERLDRRERVAVLALVGVGTVLLSMVLYWFLSRPPQMGTSEEVFRTVDALFTAVTARDRKLLDGCEKRLAGYREEGKLPASAAAALARIGNKARGGSWESAAQDLYAFMKAQRREGELEARPKRKPVLVASKGGPRR